MTALGSWFLPPVTWELGLNLSVRLGNTYLCPLSSFNSLIYTCVYVCAHAMEVRGQLVELVLSFSYVKEIELRPLGLAANTFLR